MGEDFAGTLVTDFYAAYNHFEGEKQRCWAHLLRDIDDLAEAHPTDEVLAARIVGVRAIWERATAPRKETEQGETPQVVRVRNQRARQYERELRALCPTDMPESRNEATLAERIRRYLGKLFTFVRDPAVPTTNNAAERSVRHLVISLKISGGTRTVAGSRSRMVLASLAGTARLQGVKPETAFVQILGQQPTAPAHAI